MKSRTRARVLYYGLDPAADLWAEDVKGLGLKGIQCRMNYQGQSFKIRAPMVGRHSVMTALRAAAVGLVAGMSWDEILQGLSEHKEQIRLVTARAKNGALIIDDTYNASPESTLAALSLLHDLNPGQITRTGPKQSTTAGGRRIAVLGDMLELGQYEQAGHEKVGVRAAEVADVLITLGARAHTIAQAAYKAGMDKSVVYEYEKIDPIVDWLKQNLAQDDVALIKGSRGLRMDQIVAALEVKR
jgi:UDP-N-acetylmuramoyl-tripeptide--D-alanyl-D-alanine ligase